MEVRGEVSQAAKTVGTQEKIIANCLPKISENSFNVNEKSLFQ
jgi:hypothetical protein|tara:strand:- start:541 stop:669 length:129 start_codon:yes stop_codon:yes gene_type:complete